MNTSLRHFFSLSNLFIFLSIITVIAGILIPRLMAYLPAVSGLTLTILYVLKEKKFFPFDKTLLFFFTGMVSWAALSAIWSFNGEFSLERSIKVALIVFPAFLFLSLAPQIRTQNNINYFAKILIGVFVILASYLGLEKTLDHPVTEYVLGYEIWPHKLNRAFVVLAFMSTPILFMIQKTNWKHKKVIQGALILLTGISLLQSISQTAQLCFVVGFIFLYVLPPAKKLIKLFFLGLMVLTFVLPFTITPIKNSMDPKQVNNSILREASIVHRFEIWEYSVDKAFEKPVLGNGIDSLRFMTANKWMTYQKSDQALHSHNVILQFWVEFGVIGALILIAFFVLSMKKMLAVEDKDKRRLYFSCYAVTISCAMTGYGFWQSWHLGLFMFTAALAVFIANQNLGSVKSK